MTATTKNHCALNPQPVQVWCCRKEESCQSDIRNQKRKEENATRPREEERERKSNEIERDLSERWEANREMVGENERKWKLGGRKRVMRRRRNKRNQRIVNLPQNDAILTREEGKVYLQWVGRKIGPNSAQKHTFHLKQRIKDQNSSP